MNLHQGGEAYMRIARRQVPANYHHIMIQGISKEKIFHNVSDINFYKKILCKYLSQFNLKIISYCFMSNHLHMILFSENIEDISNFMHMVNTEYAVCYNKKHERVRLCV